MSTAMMNISFLPCLRNDSMMSLVNKGKEYSVPFAIKAVVCYT